MCIQDLRAKSSTVRALLGASATIVIAMTNRASGSPSHLILEQIRRGAQRVVGLVRGLPCGTCRPDSWV
jgi:hypothetical protein